MKVIIGADHAGVEVKEKIKFYLDRKKISYEDIGTNTTDSVDYPDYAKKVARRVAKDKKLKGILVCGTGTGMVIAANRIKKVRAVAAYDNYSAKMSRIDNDSNILCLRARQFSWENTRKILNIWLNTKFSNNQKHKKRIQKLDK